MPENNSNERINIPFTNEHFAAWCLSMLGQPYWYGAVVYKCTQRLLTRKAKQYPSHYGSSRMARYKDDIAKKKVAADCIGGAKGYAWSGGGKGVLEAIGTDKTFTSKYGSNGCPDKGANSMFAYAKSKGMDWGSISTLPDIVGLALHKDGHVGYTVGDGYAVEWRGFSYGCVKTKIAGRGWTNWYKLPFINYGGGITGQPVDAPGTPTTNTPLGTRLLKRGMKGDDVKAMQELLLQLGYALPKYGADGDFGAETEKAVKAFQKDEGLKEDGKYGDKTHAALMDAVADDDEGKSDMPVEGTPPKDEGSTTPEADTGAEKPDASDAPAEDETQKGEEEAPPQDDEKPKPVGTTVVIVSNGGKVNIRCGNGTEYSRISSVAPGTTFAWIATAQNGWHAIVCGGKVGWVSGKYSRVI